MNLDDPRLNGVPGIDLTYAELTNHKQHKSVRNAWDKIGNVAEALGIPALRQNGPSVRTKTIAEFAAEILPMLPEGTDLLPIMDATAALVGYEHETTFEVRRLRTAEEAVFDVPVWVLCSEWKDSASAEDARKALAGMGFVATVIEVFTKSDRSIREPGTAAPVDFTTE